MEITQLGNNKRKDDFILDLLKMENNMENIVFSPLSIKYALQMLKEGTEGNSKKQIEDVIGNEKLAKQNNIQDVLSFANALYIRKSFMKGVKSEYKNKLLEEYNAEVKYDNFKNAKNINKWIEDKTNGQIKNMLRDDVVSNEYNKLILINALATNMEWKESFSEEMTNGIEFYLRNGEEILATTIRERTRGDNISVYKDTNITAVAIDLKEYEDRQMQFVAIMPENDLHEYIENLKIDNLREITGNLIVASKTECGIYVSIPRFSYNYELKLKDDLMKLGIADVFNSKLANLSNMIEKSRENEAYLNEALHKTNIDFTEKGIKATATTVIYMCAGAMYDRSKPIEAIINKPFMYFIRDRKTDEIWFIGTVYKPNLWEDDKQDYKYV